MLKRVSLMLIVLVSCVCCDQATKQLVRTGLPESVTYSFLGDLLRLQHTENHGAFLSIGASLSESLRFGIFTVAVACALAGMLAYLVRKPDIKAFDIAAVSLIAGGGVGNLIDRILFNGGVTDFLNLGIGSLRTGIFNIADVAIMVGFGMLLLRNIRSGHRTP
ncbi:MAG: signal peptidase II [Gammaproteobacteria bacterium]